MLAKDNRTTKVSQELSWGYSPQLYDSHGFTYTTSAVGYRVNEYDARFDYNHNAFISYQIGLDFAKHYSVHLKSGFMGAGRNYDLIPLEIQCRFYFKSYSQNSLYLYLEAGTAMHNWTFNDKIKLASLGFAYRENLYKNLCVDFFIAASALSSSPLPIDKYEGEIPRPQVLYSNVIRSYLQLGIGISF